MCTSAYILSLAISLKDDSANIKQTKKIKITNETF
jgi:hypothetical protein